MKAAPKSLADQMVRGLGADLRRSAPVQVRRTGEPYNSPSPPGRSTRKTCALALAAPMAAAEAVRIGATPLALTAPMAAAEAVRVGSALAVSPPIVAGLYHLPSWYFITLGSSLVALGALSFSFVAVLSELFNLERRRSLLPQVGTGR